MAITYFISAPSFKSTVFVVWILARKGGGGGGGGKFTPHGLTLPQNPHAK